MLRCAIYRDKWAGEIRYQAYDVESNLPVEFPRETRDDAVLDCHAEGLRVFKQRAEVELGDRMFPWTTEAVRRNL